MINRPGSKITDVIPLNQSCKFTGAGDAKWKSRCLNRTNEEVLVKAHNGKSSTKPNLAMEILRDESVRLGISPPLPLPDDAREITKFGWHLIAGYHMFTGVLEDSPNPIWHHALSTHGAPCEQCGKLLRTPSSTYCVDCGAPKTDNKTLK